MECEITPFPKSGEERVRFLFLPRRSKDAESASVLAERIISFSCNDENEIKTPAPGFGQSVARFVNATLMVSREESCFLRSLPGEGRVAGGRGRAGRERREAKRRCVNVHRTAV